MISKDVCKKKIKDFRIKHSLEATDENIIATIHLMNDHGLEENAAKDQSSRSGNDQAIDAWYYNEKKCELTIYQSKLSENKGLVLSGLNDLTRAVSWIEQVVIKGQVDKVPVDNHMLYGLYVTLANVQKKLKKIHLVLLSLYNSNELEDNSAVDNFSTVIAKSALNEYITDVLDGKITFHISEYCLETSIPRKIKKYEVATLQDSVIRLRDTSYLRLSYLSLYSLVELYRHRGDVLFDKNVRLSLMNTKELKGRLLHPMFDTFDAIVNNDLAASIFPFYHVGVTISATSAEEGKNSLFELESPSIINGCQTITLANEYMKKLEKEKNVVERDRALAKFKEIQVIAKVVVGVSEDELKEITNANNRQNPIENWQLFSNDSIHIAIESGLKEVGIFYERQKGKFDSIMKFPDNARYYGNSNGTYIKVEQLAQVIALAKKSLQFAAKPSEIFIHKKNHDQIFDPTSDRYPNDMVFSLNTLKSMNRALSNYLGQPIHAENNYTQLIFSRPIVKFNIFYLGLLFYYQNDKKTWVRLSYSKNLMKKASSNYVEEIENYFLQKVFTKVKNWYLSESNKLEHEVSIKKMESFFNDLFIELKLEKNGRFPFSNSSLQFVQLNENVIVST